MLEDIKLNKGYFAPNSDLVKRFVNDCGASINVMQSWELFAFELRMFESTHGTATRWNKLQDTITNDYKGMPEAFLGSYYFTRDHIIKSILNSDAYANWNSANMQDLYPYDLDISDFKNLKYKMIWNQETIKSDKTYWSIDMKSANFQIFRHYGMIIEKTYKEFLSKFIPVSESDMLEYFATSKYTRQVIFGKLNAGRTISLQKKWMQHVWYNNIKPLLPEGTVPVCMSNDEIYIEALSDDVYKKLDLLLNSGTLPFEFRLTKVKPVGYDYFRYTTCCEPDAKPVYEKIGEFYYNELDPESTRKYKALDSTFYKLVWTIFNQNKCTVNDLKQAKIVNINKCLCEIKDWGGVTLIQ